MARDEHKKAAEHHENATAEWTVRHKWRAAITPIRRSGTVTHSKTITSIVTPDDFESEPDAQFAAEKMIRKL